VRLNVCPLAVVAISAAWASWAAAEPARVNLTYVRKDAAAASCPDESTFRALVAARLGYDPFESSGVVALLVELTPQGPEVVGRLRLTGEHGEKRGERTLRSGDTDCLELASSMALAAAFALDPESARARADPAPAPAPAPPMPAPVAAPPPVTPAPPSDVGGETRRGRSKLGFRLIAGVLLPVGIVPAPRGGVRVGAGIDAGSWSLDAEGAFLFPSSRAASFGEVTASLAYGSLVPCLHPRLLDGAFLDVCAAGSLGATASHATGVSRSRAVTDLFAAVGPRAGVTVMPWSIAGFAATFDLPVSLSRVHLVIDDGGQRREVWAASRVGFVGGVSLMLVLR